MSSKPIKLSVLISGGGTTLMNFVARIAAGDLAAKIVQVVASGPCAGAQRAAAAGLEVVTVDRRAFRSPADFSAALTQVVTAARPDLVALGGFLHLWKFPAALDGKVMNIHPALLPAFGGHGMYGHHVHEAVLAAGCKVSGCTVHFCDRHYDSGPIIVQRCVPVQEGDTAEALAARVFEQECLAYPEAINLFAAGRLKLDGRVVKILPA
jgi:phosphoribosylglycinamide formyltransferase 1